MTYITLISFIFITYFVGLYMLLGRQNAVDILIGFSNLFIATFLVTYLLELKFSMGSRGSTLIIFGTIFITYILTFILIRFSSYKEKGNSNLEG